MFLSELNWDDVPDDVNVLMFSTTKELNFAKNLRIQYGSHYTYEGDECYISGEIIRHDIGWRGIWTLLERPIKRQNVEDNLYHDYTNPVAEFLMKLGYVVATESTIGGVDVNLKTKELLVCTDFGDITGIQEVIAFVENNYKMLKLNEANKRKQELEDKRLKVLAELSEIDQELKRYEE